MNKQWYRLEFKQVTPLHIGKYNYGVLSETRIFIPGWTMWGALVNHYGQFKGGREKDFEVGKKAFETVTCFFPMLKDKQEVVLFPEHKNGRYYFGEYTEDLFRIETTDVNISTSIQPDVLSAREESLHEIEVVLPKLRNKNQLYWAGLLALNEDRAEDARTFLKEGVEIIVGGDSRYGLGKLILNSGLVEVGNRDLEDWNMGLKGNPNLSKSLRNYAMLSGNCIVEGEIEHVITELDFSRSTPVVKESKIVIIPGSRLKSAGPPSGKPEFRLVKGIYEFK